MKLSLLLFCLHFCTSISGQYQRDITNPYKINEPAVGLTYKKVDRYKIPLMTADGLYQSGRSPNDPDSALGIDPHESVLFDTTPKLEFQRLGSAHLVEAVGEATIVVAEVGRSARRTRPHVVVTAIAVE